MAQFGRPISDVTNTGNNGFAAIDEATADDGDYWYGDNNQADELEVALTNTLSDPASSSGHTFRYRIAKTNAGTVDGGGNAVTVTARLMQGTTEIAADSAQTATGTWTPYSLALSGAQADAITDYTDLRLEFVTSASGGSPANRRGGAVSWAELEIPDAATVLSPASLVHTRALGSPIVSTTTSPSSLVHTRALGSPSVSQVTTLAPAALEHTRALGAPNALVLLSLERVRALGSPSLILTLHPPSLEHTRALGAPSSGEPVGEDVHSHDTLLLLSH